MKLELTPEQEKELLPVWRAAVTATPPRIVLIQLLRDQWPSDSAGKILMHVETVPRATAERIQKLIAAAP